MNNREINAALSMGHIDIPGVLPRLEDLEREPFIFNVDFGLDTLPDQPGLIIVRGPRQYGKSTWLQQQIRETVLRFGPGSAFYLNGDEIRDNRSLAEEIRTLVPLFSEASPVKHLFIDEITGIRDWQTSLKRLIDGGELRDTLVITTGSRATDLRSGSERLPGRKGKLDRTVYHFTPVPFPEFKRVCGDKLGARTLPAYIISGGSPIACSALAVHGRLPEYVIELTRDWVYGEIAGSGRSRSSLLGVMEVLHRFACSPVGQAKLARESGLANNTVAAGYVELLMDLMCVATAHAWDDSRKRPNKRRPAKFPMTNLLVAVAWHPRNLRTIDEFLALPEKEQASLLEWAVAQELWRRAAIRGDDFPEYMLFWQGKDHELDFVLGMDDFIELKRGRTTPVEFSWFPRSFPQGRLTVVSSSRYETRNVRGVTLEDFLSGA